MPEKDFLDKLAAKAREAKVPEVDVTSRIMSSIEPYSSEVVDIGPLYWVAAAAAVLTATVGLYLYSSLAPASLADTYYMAVGMGAIS